MHTAISIADRYVQTINEHDAEAYLRLFADSATVDDVGRRFRGIAAIKAWSHSVIFDVRVTLKVLGQQENHDRVQLSTKVDGNFDRTGLPDPVIIVHDLVVEEERIVALTCSFGLHVGNASER